MAANSLSEFADRLNEVLPTLIQGFARRQANELYKGKITLPQFLILNFLSRQGESNMTDIARLMQVTTAATTGIVDRLLRDGYVARAHDSLDRRVIKVKLTGRGDELVKRINNQRRQMVINIFGSLSAADRRDYLRILLEIKDILTKEKHPKK